MVEFIFSLAATAGFVAILLLFTKRFRKGAFGVLLCAACVGYVASRFVDFDASTSTSSPGSVPINSKVRLNRAFYGCSDQRDLDRVRKMLRAGDRQAMSKAASQGGCAELDAGVLGTVTDISMLHDSTCVRRMGEPDCLWVPTGAIEKVHEAASPS